MSEFPKYLTHYLEATLLQVLLNEHVSDCIEDVSDVTGFSSAGEVNEDLLKYFDVTKRII